MEQLYKIHNQDCVQGLQRLSEGTVDIAFADPPFNIGYEYDVYKDNQSYHKYLDWSREWMGAVCRVLKPAGTFWLAIGDEYAAELKLIARNDLKLTCRSWVIWYYTFGVNCTKKFSRSHAHLFHFVKNPRKYTFNTGEIRVPSARQLVYADSRGNPDGRLPDDTWVLRPQDVPDGFAADQDTWYFARVAGTFKERAGFHGCQMPEQLLGRILRASSNPGDVVLDPFAGSGTTLVVAKKLGRKWLGFDVSAKYVQQASKRIEQVREDQPLAGPANPLLSAPRTQQGRRLTVSESAASEADVAHAIVDAFKATNQGFSSDRVIADPELNSSFVAKCQGLGIRGTAYDWNRVLMRLRKAGELAALPRSRRTTFSWEQLDEYLFASEIAMRRLSEGLNLSLDAVLCDPSYAQKFDEIAAHYAPGYAPLQYRWGALRLRKRAHDFRCLVVEPQLLRRRLSYLSLQDLDVNRVSAIPGVYLLRSEKHLAIYAGETFDLAKRFQKKIENVQAWREPASGELQVGYIKLEGRIERCGFYASLIAQHSPILNYSELAPT